MLRIERLAADRIHPGRRPGSLPREAAGEGEKEHLKSGIPRCLPRAEVPLDEIEEPSGAGLRVAPEAGDAHHDLPQQLLLRGRSIGVTHGGSVYLSAR